MHLLVLQYHTFPKKFMTFRENIFSENVIDFRFELFYNTFKIINVLKEERFMFKKSTTLFALTLCLFLFFRLPLSFDNPNEGIQTLDLVDEFSF